MSYIIAATDFSDVSKNGVQYAAGLAQALKINVVIMHTFSMPVMVGETPIPASMIDDLQDDAEEEMNKLVADMQQQYRGVMFRGVVACNTVIEGIETYAATHRKPLLTILGNTLTTEHSAWMFSTLREATNDLSFPVLAVPPGATFVQSPKICLALDIRMSNSIQAMEKLNDLSIQLSSTLHVLNVQNDVYNRDNIADVSNEVQVALKDAKPHYHFQYEDEIDDAVQKFCDDNKINWLAVVRGKYSFLEGLTHKSHTKALATKAEIPLLILHEGQN